MTVSKHTIVASVALPDHVTTAGGEYVDSGSWQTVDDPQVVEQHDMDTMPPARLFTLQAGTAVLSTSTDPAVDDGAVLHCDVPDTGSGWAWLTPPYAPDQVTITVRMAPLVDGGVAVFPPQSGEPLPVIPAGTWAEYSFSAGPTDQYRTGGVWWNVPCVIDWIKVTSTSVWVPDLVWVPGQTLVAGQRVPLAVEQATVTLDDGWAPYGTAQLVCTQPASDLLARIDPRRGQRLRVDLVQAFNEGDPISTYTATWDGLSCAGITALYPLVQVAAITSDFATPYNAGGTRASTRRTLDLALRERTVDWTAGTVTLVGATDEALAQDAGMNDSTGVTFASTSIRAAVVYALATIGAVLDDDDDEVDAQADDVDGLTWPPGMSVWDYMAGLVSAAQLRLWCDERRAWHLVDPTAPTQRAAALTPLAVEISDGIGLDGAWYDGVQVQYEWTDGAGATQRRYDTAGARIPKRLKVVQWRRQFIRRGAAAAMLRRLQGAGRSVNVTAVSDYGMQPGDVFTIDLLDGATDVGALSSVTWSMPGDEMSVTTRDLIDAPAHSWLIQPPAVGWDDLPAGVAWPDADQEVTA